MSARAVVMAGIALALAGAGMGPPVHAEEPNPKDVKVSATVPLKLSGYVEARYRDDPSITDTFDVRRARLTLQGDLGKGFDLRIQVELANSTKLLDAALRWHSSEAFRLSAGQFKIPFSQENLTSSNKLETINRSLVVEALVARSLDVIGNQNGRDIGVMGSGTVPFATGATGLDWSVGVFNGAGVNTADTNDRKDLIGRVVVRPLADVSIGASGYSGRFTLASRPGRDDVRRRVGGEIACLKGPWLLKAEYIRGTDARTDREGWYVLGGVFVIPSRLQAIVKAEAYDPDTAVTGNGQRVATFGGNWIFSPNAFLQVDYEVKREGRIEIANDALTVQLTLQF